MSEKTKTVEMSNKERALAVLLEVAEDASDQDLRVKAAEAVLRHTGPPRSLGQFAQAAGRQA